MPFVKNKKPRRRASIRRISEHEAAHAVVALYLGRKVHGAFVDTRKRIGGTYMQDIKRNRDPFTFALTCLAGDAVERRIYKASRSRHSYGDMREVMRVGFGQRSAMTLMLYADQLVVRLRHPIRRVARALEEKHYLSSREIKRLARIEA